MRLKAHSLAGIGGNITAEALRAACKSFEKAAYHGNIKELQTRFTELSEEFERVIEGIAAIEETIIVGAAPSAKSDFDSKDLNALYRILKELEKYLGDFDPVGAESAKSRIEDTGVPTELASDYHELCRKLQDLDYAAAEAALTRMQKTLHDLMRMES